MHTISYPRNFFNTRRAIGEQWGKIHFSSNNKQKEPRLWSQMNFWYYAKNSLFQSQLLNPNDWNLIDSLFALLFKKLSCFIFQNIQQQNANVFYRCYEEYQVENEFMIVSVESNWGKKSVPLRSVRVYDLHQFYQNIFYVAIKTAVFQLNN